MYMSVISCPAEESIAAKKNRPRAELFFCLQKKLKNRKSFFQQQWTSRPPLEKNQNREAILIFFGRPAGPPLLKKNLPYFLVSFASKKKRQKKTSFFGGRILQEISKVQNLCFLCPRDSVWPMVFFILLRPYGFEKPPNDLVQKLGGGGWCVCHTM